MQPHAFLAAGSPAPRWNRRHWTLVVFRIQQLAVWRVSGDRCCIRQTRFDLAALQRTLGKICETRADGWYWCPMRPAATLENFRDALRQCLSSAELARELLCDRSLTARGHRATTARHFPRLLSQPISNCMLSAALVTSFGKTPPGRSLNKHHHLVDEFAEHKIR